MKEAKTNSSRRAFFLQGGAVLGATTTVASTITGCASAQEGRRSSDGQLQELRRQLDLAAAREAIRNLHVAFMALVESQAYEAAVELFDEEAYLQLGGAGANASARGKPAIRRLFSEQYRGQNGAAIHSAYRQNASRQNDIVTFADDRLQASATFHVEAELCAPLQGDCTAAQMARLQGQVESRSWEAGRFEARYVKTAGKWQMLSLVYVSA